MTPLTPVAAAVIPPTLPSPAHRWSEVIFSFGTWLECDCGYSALSDEQRIAHEQEYPSAQDRASVVIAAVRRFHASHEGCVRCSPQEEEL